MKDNEFRLSRRAELREATIQDAVSLIGRVAIMTMADDRDGDIPSDHVKRVFLATIEALKEDKQRARRTLGIIDTGLDTVGATFRFEFGAMQHGSTNEVVLRSTSEAALHTANVWGRGARAVQRRTADWPDGGRYIGPWKDIEPDETEDAAAQREVPPDAGVRPDSVGGESPRGADSASTGQLHRS